MNYHTALTTLGKRDTKKIGNNTYLVRLPDGAVAVRLHQTNILTYAPTGEVTINTGGWHTVTTKSRLNDHLEGVRVYQKQRLWYIVTIKGEKTSYMDGIILKEGQIVYSPLLPEAVTDHDKDRTTLKNKVNQYVKNFMTELKAGRIQKPSNGDCWYCCMIADDGQTLGEKTRQRSDAHIQTHIEEAYYVPSLLLRACQVMGVSEAARSWVGMCLGYVPQEQIGYVEGVGQRQVESALRRYVMRELGFGN